MIYLGNANGGYTSLNTAVLLTIAIGSVAVWLLFYALMGVGLMTMAKKRANKHWYFAWIPVLRFYLIGELAGAINVLGKNYKNLSVVFMVVTLIAALLSVLSAGFMYGEIALKVLGGGDVFFEYAAESGGYVVPEFVNATLFKIGDILSYVSSVFGLIEIFVGVMVYAALFKGYNPRRYVLNTVFSVLGFESICIFIARKDEFKDYNEFIRERYRAYQQQYQGQGQGNPYGQPPFGQNNNQPPYGQNNGQNGSQGAPIDPFADEPSQNNGSQGGFNQNVGGENQNNGGVDPFSNANSNENANSSADPFGNENGENTENSDPFNLSQNDGDSAEETEKKKHRFFKKKTEDDEDDIF